jgi:hypothetical protein
VLRRGRRLLNRFSRMTLYLPQYVPKGVLQSRKMHEMPTAYSRISVVGMTHSQVCVGYQRNFNADNKEKVYKMKL